MDTQPVIPQTPAPAVPPAPAPAPMPAPAPAGSQAGTYQPVGVAAVEPKHPGMTQGICGIVCAVLSLLFLPPVFGIAGIVLGILALRKNQVALGITAIVLSAVFMVIGMIISFYVHTHADALGLTGGPSVTGAVIEPFLLR
jgi:hypothetical protein